MEDAGRWIVFVTVPEAGDDAAGREALAALETFFNRTADLLAEQEGSSSR
jgi:hypothetical protein